MNANKIASLVLFLSILLIVSNCNNWNTADESAIMKTSLDYIEGWYTGDSIRMERALHPNMVKRIVINPDQQYSSMEELNKEEMVSYTKLGGGKDVPKDNYKIQVKIVDINHNIASVITKSEYIDYLQLAKFNNQWVIINVLWDMNRE